MRFFNTAGPSVCERHYCIEPLERFNLEEMLSLIDQQKYFVLHAPRQTGKTTCLLALMDYLNKEGKYKCLYINVEAAQGAREDVRRGIRAILNELGTMARLFLKDGFVKENQKNILEESGEDAALNEMLTLWAMESAKPIVLLMDEIDSLTGDTLISVLRQIRAGYAKRPAMFPQSIVLCGIRDVRDYRIHSSRQKEIITGGSAFNIKAKSLRLGDFSKKEVQTLYDIHTDETGQKFHDDAIDLAWDLTQGQPWLTNALAYEACFDMKEGRDRSIPVTAEMIARAKDNIILRRETHIDQLFDKLKEDRVKRVISPILTGTEMENMAWDDIQYLVDLGLIKKTGKGFVISNALYMEVIPRELTLITQENLAPRFDPAWYVAKDGVIEMKKLLEKFQQFFRENSEVWIERFDYKEAGPQLLLQAFLQRVVNGGGSIYREYGLGRRRTDLLLVWPHDKGEKRIVIELKILYKSLEKTIAEGLEQTFQYMDRCGAETGHLVIFDREENKSWDDKIFYRKDTFKGSPIGVWGM
ncbi:conserved hypothetical protein [Candidatus Desulfarcum epimagneticum]|uniref:ORC1/DEAH AAA+ ATPase domain-containing protein n=1 Tax=uncultured Desulfobacteraceae bacterium TaxID=218296 RepID=A0A484HIJ7_9BACT|nr:conserved hypothetical protein [uncultured Desulfobacteraceae bacterium]